MASPEAFEADLAAREHRDGLNGADWRPTLAQFEIALAGGLPYAAHDVAWCHFWGLGTPRDPAKSAAVLAQAIVDFPTWVFPRVSLAAQCALGTGMRRDETRAQQLLLEAGSPLYFDAGLWDTWLEAWSGMPPAQYAIGLQAADSQAPAAWEFREAERWLRAAADAGLADAQYELARLFEKQMPGPRDFIYRNAASIWKWKAAWQKHERALHELREARDGLMGALMDDEE
jgi:TPR repeat protein